jgi:hypothetical protein
MHIIRSRDSSVGIALGYGLDDRGSRVLFPAGAGNFSLHHCVQKGSGAHTTSYPMVPGVLSLGVKPLGREAVHSPPSSAGGGSKNEWRLPPLPQYAFMAWCLVKAQGQLYLYVYLYFYLYMYIFNNYFYFRISYFRFIILHTEHKRNTR